MHIYDEQKRFPPFEWARKFSACLCIGKEAYGDLKKWDYRELAEKSGVTEEFALFRIGLEVEQQ